MAGRDYIAAINDHGFHVERGVLNVRQIDELIEVIERSASSDEPHAMRNMRPLLLHASSAASVPLHRRVIHLEFAAAMLPLGLEWHESIPLPPNSPRIEYPA